MAKFKVTKTPLKDSKTKRRFELGEVIDRTLKQVAEFEKEHGTGYLERVDVKDGG